jgi:hypothetical protein
MSRFNIDPAAAGERRVVLKLSRMLGAWVLPAYVAVAATAVYAQRPRADTMPSAEIIAQADRYQPRMLNELAAKLAQQPDMTGTWVIAQPSDAPEGPLFDPEHAVILKRPAKGEATFGPVPGTYDAQIPYTPAYEKLYRQHIQEVEQGHARDTFAACVPYGVPRMIGDNPVSFDIIQAPEVMIWYANYGRTERRIFLDGRNHPKMADPNTFDSGPSYSGHSIGHWEGTTLVVDTVSMIPAFFDETESPHSDQLHLVERLRLIGDNFIENEITLSDSVAFTHPWVLKRYYKRSTKPSPDAPEKLHNYLTLNDRPCIPNVRIDENGFQVVLLPQEMEAEAAKARGKPTPH